MDKKQLFELIGEASETYVTEEPVISKNNYFSGRKKMIAVIAAAALLIALGISAGAKYYFSLPKDLEENLHLESVDITSFAEDGIMPQGKTVSTCGYLVTFRALARGDRLNDIVMGLGDGSNIVKSREETFAIFTLEKEDGGAIDFDISDLSYIITMRGYEPNSLMFQQFKAATAENNVIYFACSVTDAVPFADHELGIVLTQELPVDGFVMRMDENGNAYFMPGIPVSRRSSACRSTRPKPTRNGRRSIWKAELSTPNRITRRLTGSCGSTRNTRRTDPIFRNISAITNGAAVIRCSSAPWNMRKNSFHAAANGKTKTCARSHSTKRRVIRTNALRFPKTRRRLSWLTEAFVII